MGALSGKVIIVIIAFISVVVISSIVIPIVVIYSGEESTKNSAKVPITESATTAEPTNGGGTISFKFSYNGVKCFVKKFI